MMSRIRECILNWFQSLAIRIIKIGKLPKHVAFIMDGNRRYAKQQNIEKRKTHTKGYHKMCETLKWCIDFGIPEITVYALSIENFKRSKEEIDELMDLGRRKFKRVLKEKERYMDNGVCIRVIGNLSMIPDDLRNLIAEVMIVTGKNDKTFFNLAFPYTSRDEITRAIKDIAQGIKHTDISPEDINEDLFTNCLYTYKSSSPDLLIRTSGEIRLSDFLMWQTSNTCIYFTKVLWPEFNIWNFLSAIFYYQKCYPDLQKVKNNLKPIKYNTRASMYINKLHNERDTMIESQISRSISG